MPSRKRRSAEQWRTLINDYIQSGESVDQFCNHAGISPSSLYKWMSKLNFSKKSSDFIPMPIPERRQKLPDDSVRSAEFTYISPNGAVLQWSGNPPYEYLARLIGGML